MESIRKKNSSYKKIWSSCFTEVNPEEGAGDNGPEVAGGEEPALQVEDNQILWSATPSTFFWRLKMLFSHLNIRTLWDSCNK